MEKTANDTKIVAFIVVYDLFITDRFPEPHDLALVYTIASSVVLLVPNPDYEGITTNGREFLEHLTKAPEISSPIYEAFATELKSKLLGNGTHIETELAALADHPCGKKVNNSECEVDDSTATTVVIALLPSSSNNYYAIAANIRKYCINHLSVLSSILIMDTLPIKAKYNNMNDTRRLLKNLYELGAIAYILG